MQPILCELELDKVKVTEKRLYPEFNTHIPPDITPNTRILVVLGINPKEAAPNQDGWFLSELFAFYHMFRGLTKNQIWMHGLDLDRMIAARGMADIQVPDEELQDRFDIPPQSRRASGYLSTLQNTLLSFLSQSWNNAADRRIPATGPGTAVCIQRRPPPTLFLFSPSSIPSILHSSLCLLTYLSEHVFSTTSTSKYTQPDLRISAH